MPGTTLSSAEYRTIVERAPLLVWRSGLDALCDYFNEGWLAFTGRPLARELGDGWTEGVHPADLAGRASAYRRAFKARAPYEREYRLRRRDGLYRWLRERASPYADARGRFAGFIGSCVDVTERLEAQERLAALQRRLLKRLNGLLALCTHCRKVSDEQGAWVDLESFVRVRAPVDYSHGICPDCVRRHYPGSARRARR